MQQVLDAPTLLALCLVVLSLLILVLHIAGVF